MWRTAQSISHHSIRGDRFAPLGLGPGGCATSPTSPTRPESTLELERDNLTKLSDAGLSEVMFGIRPEQLEIADSGGVEVVVDLVEDLGSEAYVYTHAGSGVELVARCNPRTAPKLADTVRLRRGPESVVHLFHPESGERLN